jgi:hypothetical protein
MSVGGREIRSVLGKTFLIMKSIFAGLWVPPPP